MQVTYWWGHINAGPCEVVLMQVTSWGGEHINAGACEDGVLLQGYINTSGVFYVLKRRVRSHVTDGQDARADSFEVCDIKHLNDPKGFKKPT